MAGEWLKFDASTPEKPEVFSMTVALGWDDPDLTVGKLMRVWRWFDQHTIDGNAPNVTLALLDRVSGVTGFAQAMCDVGWLVKDDAGLSLPHFDRHNGKTAKDRALTAKRVANHKANKDSNDEGNDDSVSDALPREEKRREEKNIKTLKSKAEAATPLALPTWVPIDSWNAYLEMRKKKRKEPTFYACQLVIVALEKLHHAGHDVKTVLDASTKNGWTDVYAPKSDQQARASPAKPEKFNPTAYVNRPRNVQNERPIITDATGEPL